MNAESQEHQERIAEAQETPLCLRCLRPVDPRAYYCPYCGEATGQLTPYLPVVNIPWETGIWGRMWRQVWSRDVSIPGRLFRLFMILWNVPILLMIGLVIRLWHWPEKEEHPPAAQPEDEDDPASIE
jgi:hypothetical protein